MSSVEFKSHVNEVLYKKQQAIDVALEMIGLKAEKYAKGKCPVDTGRLRNSITHAQIDKETEAIGTNVEYAAYVPC